MGVLLDSSGLSSSLPHHTRHPALAFHHVPSSPTCLSGLTLGILGSGVQGTDGDSQPVGAEPLVIAAVPGAGPPPLPWMGKSRRSQQTPSPSLLASSVPFPCSQTNLKKMRLLNPFSSGKAGGCERHRGSTEYEVRGEGGERG